MGVLDKFLDAMKLNDDDDFDDDFFDDEDFDDTPKKRKFKKTDIDDDDDFMDEKPAKVKPMKQASNKVTPMRQPRRTGSGMEVCVIKPTSFEDTREITETLLSDRTVVLNMEGLDMELAQRIIDFTSGSCFAINGNLQKISSFIFIVTPSSVDISGDLQDILNGAFDVPAIQTDF